MDEFALIRRYFAGLTPAADDVALGVGDDAALLVPPAAHELVATADTLVAGRHFPEDAAPFDIGWKALAVNLSDLAAMGAVPRWFLLCLTRGDDDPAWLGEFSHGLGCLARESGIALVGGDTTRGPLSVSITAMGLVPSGSALRRSGAQVGDRICVTGTLGDAALALDALNDRLHRDGQTAAAPPRADTTEGHSARMPGRLRSGEPDFDFLYSRLDRPSPRLAAGRALRRYAHAAIDLSDGLAGDLRHVLEASGVGAEIESGRLPMSAEFARRRPRTRSLQLQAAGGDDYELCVCLPPECLQAARDALGDLPLTPIGQVVAEPGLRWWDGEGRLLEGPAHGYRHF